jgi:hypothetical protein
VYKRQTLRDIWPRRAIWLAAAAPAAALFFSSTVADSTWSFAGAILLWALAVAAAAYSARQELVTPVVTLAVYVAAGVGLSAAAGPWPLTVIAFALVSMVLGSLTLFPAFSPRGSLRVTGGWLAISGAIGLAFLVVSGAPSATGMGYGAMPDWADLGRQGLAISLLLLGAYVVTHAVRWRVEPMEYAGWAAVLLGVLAQLWAAESTGIELYTTPIAMYAAGMGYLYAWRHPDRGVPLPLDAMAVLIGLGMPVLRTVTDFEGDAIFHLMWAVGLSVAAIVSGIGLRVRWYFYGGVSAIAVATGWRTIVYLAGVWWVVIGLIGVAAIVVALTWERQRVLLKDAVLWTQGWR